MMAEDQAEVRAFEEAYTYVVSRLGEGNNSVTPETVGLWLAAQPAPVVAHVIRAIAHSFQHEMLEYPNRPSVQGLADGSPRPPSYRPMRVRIAGR